MTQSTRYYLEQESTQTKDENIYSDIQTGKLKLNKYNLSQDVTDEAPTYYSSEQEATQIATVLNLYSKLLKNPTYVDIYKEEVTITKVSDNDPRPKPEHKVDVETEETTNNETETTVEE